MLASSEPATFPITLSWPKVGNDQGLRCNLDESVQRIERLMINKEMDMVMLFCVYSNSIGVSVAQPVVHDDFMV